MTEDAQLLVQYATNRSETAFADLVRGRIDLVYTVALRCVGGDGHRAAEVTQDVFLSLARNARRLAHHPVLAAWLHATTRNAAANLLRGERRRENRNQRAQVMQAIELAQRPLPEWETLRAALDDVLYELNDLDRQAIVLRFFENSSYSELGSKLSLREEAARMRVTRALEKLRARLGKRGITSTAAALGVALANQAVGAAPSGLAATITGLVMATAPAVAVPPAIAFLHLMSTTKSIAIAGGAVLLLGIGISTHEIFVNRKAKADLDVANEAYETAGLQLKELEQRLNTADSLRTSLLQEIGQRRATASDRSNTPPANKTSAISHAPAVDGRSLGRSHPEVMRAFEAVQRSRYAAEYSPLFAELGLTPEQQEEFEKIVLSVSNGTYGIGVGDQTVEFPWERTATPDGQRSALQALLGESGYQQLQEFNRVNAARTVTSELAASSLDLSSPLTPEQANQMVQVLLASSASYQQGRSVELASLNWQNASATAGSLLTTEQLAALDSVHQQMLFQQAMQAASKPGP